MKKLHHTATGLYAAAFAADPKLADDLKAGHRYRAACAAALAAAGQGEDAAKLDDKEKVRLRKQALDWLIRRPRRGAAGVALLAEGQRPRRPPRRGSAGQTIGGRAEGIHPALGRCGGVA